MSAKHYVTLRSRSGRFHIQLEKRALWIMGGLALALLIIGVMSVGWGDTYVHPWEVLRAIWGRGTGDYDFILYRLRFPRALTGVLVGAALGIAGAVLQGIIRNPLASPDILGITGGSSLAAVPFIAYWGAVLRIHLLPVLAVAGALLDRKCPRLNQILVSYSFMPSLACTKPRSLTPLLPFPFHFFHTAFRCFLF
ncbi:iron ABC transporter permease, partial [Paenibacillus sp. 28ISP30-2]|nr:iron ABC transporter permease [Paenibacillus sp. 28ISP30-2]